MVKLIDMKTYICPMHADIQSEKPGKCTKCGMRLVLKEEIEAAPKIKRKSSANGLTSYTPLAVIIGLIVLVTLALGLKDFSSNTFSFRNSISTFMVGFFLIFSGFKMLDIKGFAEGYSTYDLLAQRVFSYGYIYPFIELFFGLAMILSFKPILILSLEAIVMGFSGLGVAIKLLKHERFQCACLGTFLKVPLTKVTLIEDFGMMILALLLLKLSL